MDFATTIIQWFRENGRALPWRETRDPYAIWLSEIILQQTRIEQGRPYWERFMQRWPTVEALAEASEDEVLRLWQGLGYYSRARNLHAAAKQVLARGGFPATSFPATSKNTRSPQKFHYFRGFNSEKNRTFAPACS